MKKYNSLYIVDALLTVPEISKSGKADMEEGGGFNA